MSDATLSDTAPDVPVKPAIAEGAVPRQLAPRDLKGFNRTGLETLILKEVQRFMKVGMQTVLAPMITSLLFFTVFSLALGGVVREAGDVPFLTFLAPGLVMMGVIQNAFANTSSSVVIGKVQDNIVDVLMAPLSHTELLLGWSVGGMVRGVIVGAATLVVLVPFAGLGLHNLWLVLYHVIMGSLMLSLLGIAAGIWADKFDHIAAVQNFVVMPLTFLSGTFYSIDRLPEDWQFIAHFNPFFYMIDGFRHGFIGHESATVWTGIVVVGLCTLALWVVTWQMLRTGYKLKS